MTKISKSVLNILNHHLKRRENFNWDADSLFISIKKYAILANLSKTLMNENYA